MQKGQDDPYDSLNKAQIVEKTSIASASSYQFGGERMIKAQRGVLERQGLEDNGLSADGEEWRVPCEFFPSVFDDNTLLNCYLDRSVFTRPTLTSGHLYL